MFQEKVRTDDAVRRKAAAKNLADSLPGSWLPPFGRQHPASAPSAGTTVGDQTKGRYVAGRGWGLLMRSMMQKEAHFVYARIQPRPAIHGVLFGKPLEARAPPCYIPPLCLITHCCSRRRRGGTMLPAERRQLGTWPIDTPARFLANSFRRTASSFCMFFPGTTMVEQTKGGIKQGGVGGYLCD